MSCRTSIFELRVLYHSGQSLSHFYEYYLNDELKMSVFHVRCKPSLLVYHYTLLMALCFFCVWWPIEMSFRNYCLKLQIPEEVNDSTQIYETWQKLLSGLQNWTPYDPIVYIMICLGIYDWCNRYLKISSVILSSSSKVVIECKEMFFFYKPFNNEIQ